jgi:hypothetical protein
MGNPDVGGEGNFPAPAGGTDGVPMLHTCEHGPEKECPWYYVLSHPEGHQHCQECHGQDPDGPRCGHAAGCPGC